MVRAVLGDEIVSREPLGSAGASGNKRFGDLCGLEDRYNLLSPPTGRRERERGVRSGELIMRCWEHTEELVPSEIATAIVALAERPAPLAALLDTCEPTLIHGDVRLNNLGFSDDRVVLVDWGERTGSAPAPVELASFLIFDAKGFDVSCDDVVAEFRSLYGDRFDENAFELALRRRASRARASCGTTASRAAASSTPSCTRGSRLDRRPIASPRCLPLPARWPAVCPR